MIDRPGRGVSASRTALACLVLTVALVASPRLASALAETPGITRVESAPLRIDVRISPAAAKTGDHVTATATVTNTSERTLRNVAVFLGLVDLSPGAPTPLSLETWTNDPESAALPVLDPGASATARWRLIMIEPGALGIYASAIPRAAQRVDSSPLTRLSVQDARVLNPAHVLPLTVGEPVALAALVAAVAIGRSRVHRRAARGSNLVTPWMVMVVAASTLFLALALTARFGGVSAGERGAYVWVLAETAAAGDTVFRWLNHLGDVWALVPISVVIVAALGHDVLQRWWLWLGTMLGAGSLEVLGKFIVGRPRPSGHALGFPSGHVTAAAAFFVIAAYLVAKRGRTRAVKTTAWALAVVSIVVVALARMALHAHWPLDVLGGAALGIACGGAAAGWNEAHPYPDRVGRQGLKPRTR
jgi:membrane-associated phospholipid phosphatase